MSKILDKLARKALATFATEAIASSQSAQSFNVLSICSAALAQLVSHGNNQSGDSAVLSEAARGCTVQLLEQMRSLPSTEMLETKATFRIFKIVKDSALFLSEQESYLLLEQVDRLTDAVSIGVWSPAHLLACLHAVAKGCPKMQPPSLVSDILLCLEHNMSRLGPREVASFMWCMAVLRLHETNAALWHKVCHRVCALFSTMNEVSKATVAHCAFLVPECITPELNQALYITYTGRYESGGGGGGGDGADVWREAVTPREREIQRGLKIRMLTNTNAYSAELLLTAIENALNASTFVEVDDDVRLAAHHLSRRTLTPHECFRILLLNDRNISPTYQLDSHNNTFGFLYRHALRTLLSAAPSSSSSSSSTTVAGAALPPLMTLLSLSTLLSASMRQAFLPFGVDLDAETTRKVWDVLAHTTLEGVRMIESDFDSPSGEIAASLAAANAVITCGLLSAQIPPSLMPDAEVAAAKAAALLRTIPAHWFRSSRPGLDKCANFITKMCQLKDDLLLVAVDNPLTREMLSMVSADRPSQLQRLPFARLLDLIYVTETAPRPLQALLAPLTASLLGQVELQRIARKKMLYDLTSVLRLRTMATGAAVPDSLFSIYIEALLSETNTAECPQNSIDLVVACLAQRADNVSSLETGFMQLMTRQLGQEKCFAEAVSLNPATIVRLINLASVLLAKNMSVGVSILSTLFQLLSDSVERKCHNLQALNEVASVFSSDVCVKLHMKEKLVEAVEKQAIALLSQPNNFSSVDKAFFIAHFVSSKVPITAELNQALHLVYDGKYVV